MKTLVVNARRAAFGWPFYVTWNLAAVREGQGRGLRHAARNLHDCTMGVRMVHLPLDDMASRKLGPSLRAPARPRQPPKMNIFSACSSDATSLSQCRRRRFAVSSRDCLPRLIGLLRGRPIRLMAGVIQRRLARWWFFLAHENSMPRPPDRSRVISLPALESEDPPVSPAGPSVQRIPVP